MGGFDKILRGVIQFQKSRRSQAIKYFEEVKKGAHATAVFFSCMDARMTPLSFTDTHLGEMYIVRNAGNMVPQAAYNGSSGYEVVERTEPAALELTVGRGKIQHVIICGHSDCKAMDALYNMKMNPGSFNERSALERWIRHYGSLSIEKLEKRLKNGKQTELQFANADNSFAFRSLIDPEEKYDVKDKLSQINTLQQVENASTHISEALKRRETDIHGFWFDIAAGDMHLFSRSQKRFVVINERTVKQLIKEVQNREA